MQERGILDGEGDMASREVERCARVYYRIKERMEGLREEREREGERE